MSNFLKNQINLSRQLHDCQDALKIKTDQIDKYIVVNSPSKLMENGGQTDGQLPKKRRGGNKTRKILEKSIYLNNNKYHQEYKKIKMKSSLRGKIIRNTVDS